jgi:hypothetical protein
MEVTQFTYFQQAGGKTLEAPSVEITYGLERILMALQVRPFVSFLSRVWCCEGQFAVCSSMASNGVPGAHPCGAGGGAVVCSSSFPFRQLVLSFSSLVRPYSR